MFITVLTKEAQLDLDEIFAWWEEQKTGLGFDLIDCFEITLYKISTKNKNKVARKSFISFQMVFIRLCTFRIALPRE